MRNSPMRSAWDAVDKVTEEIGEGREWIVDADLKDFFTTVDHGKLGVTLNREKTRIVPINQGLEFLGSIPSWPRFGLRFHPLHKSLARGSACPRGKR